MNECHVKCFRDPCLKLPPKYSLIRLNFRPTAHRWAGFCNTFLLWNRLYSISVSKGHVPSQSQRIISSSRETALREKLKEFRSIKLERENELKV